MFQSPSLRGSGRFPPEAVAQAMVAARFNPLHCGAVVASRRGAGSAPPAHRVSIPFIAGQWSLPDGSGGVDPAPVRVSIPFIAGQWSLPRTSPRPALTPSSFNPLHCGAVVASAARLWGARRTWSVSIPFIAGQWSLLGGIECGPCSRLKFQSPSLRGSGRFAAQVGRGGALGTLVSIPFIAGQWSLRAGSAPPAHRCKRVSIPFIAGQWSLPALDAAQRALRPVFQSPSLRGSGRFSPSRSRPPPAASGFQSPSLRGSGRFRGDARVGDRRAHVSIPFIAGQWSLPTSSTP